LEQLRYRFVRCKEQNANPVIFVENSRVRLVIQRVREANIVIDGIQHARIGHGMLLLLGVHATDTEKDASWLVSKLIQMRIFSDDAGKMNLDILQTNGEILVVSQFTLFASTKKGNRPGFTEAAIPSVAIPLYEYFCSQLEIRLPGKIKKGVFGADMKIGLVNDGPVTICMDSKNKE